HAGIGLQRLDRAAGGDRHAVDGNAGADAGGVQLQLAAAAAPRQAAAKGRALGAVVAPGDAAAGEVDVDVRGRAGAAEAGLALDDAGGAGQEVREVQRRQAGVDVQPLGDRRGRLDPAVAKRQRQLAVVVRGRARRFGGRAVDGEAAAAVERASAQLAAEVGHVDLDLQPAVVAGGAA